MHIIYIKKIQIVLSHLKIFLFLCDLINSIYFKLFHLWFNDPVSNL